MAAAAAFACLRHWRRRIAFYSGEPSSGSPRFGHAPATGVTALLVLVGLGSAMSKLWYDHIVVVPTTRAFACIRVRQCRWCVAGHYRSSVHTAELLFLHYWKLKSWRMVCIRHGCRFVHSYGCRSRPVASSTAWLNSTGAVYSGLQPQANDGFPLLM